MQREAFARLQRCGGDAASHGDRVGRDLAEARIQAGIQQRNARAAHTVEHGCAAHVAVEIEDRVSHA